MDIKVIAIEVDELPLETDEIFSMKGEKEGEAYFFNSSRIRRMVDEGAEHRIDTVRFDLHDFYHIQKNNGIEPGKIERLSERPDIYMQPPLIADFDDGKSIIIDGNHRVMIQGFLACGGGRPVPTYIDCIRVSRSVWEKGLVPFPPELADIFI